jgi:peptide/nickel transport system permease protein
VIGHLRRRLPQAAVVLVLVTMIVFGLERLLPGGPARALLGPNATPANVARFNAEHGLDRPVPAQYATWVSDVVRGDLGFSYNQNRAVRELLAERLPRSLLVVGPAVFLALVLAVPLGLLQAVRRGSAADYSLTAASFVFYSMPVFWLALLAVELFAVRMQWLPSQAPQGGVADALHDPAGLVLPIATLALVSLAAFSRYVRSSTLDNLAQDHVRTARAKGASTTRIVLRHTLRGSLGPVATLVGFSIPAMVGGTIVVESVFNYPGMGLLFYQAALTQDFPILLGVTLVVAVATVIGSFVADLLYAALDPRVRYGPRVP